MNPHSVSKTIVTCIGTSTPLNGGTMSVANAIDITAESPEGLQDRIRQGR